MTRETKIGLLTGLGVIILIGVLLSQYLGGPDATPRSANLSSLGDSYRQQQLQPTGVDPTVKPEGTLLAGVDAPTPSAPSTPGAATPTVDPMIARLPTRDGISGAPVAAAPTTAVMPPLVSDPVSAQPAGPVIAGPTADTAAMPPVEIGSTGNGLERAIYVPADPTKPQAATPPVANPAGNVPTGTFYTVAKGDTLSSISKHFYKSSSKTNFAKIVAANPTVLKDEKTPLVIGKKLLIPDSPKAIATVTGTPAMPTAGPAAPVPSNTLVLRPDTGTTVAPTGLAPTTPRPGTAVAAAPTAASKSIVYRVQAGDTLSKLAKEFMGNGSKQAIRQIMKTNKLEDDALEVGMILRIPAKAAA